MSDRALLEAAARAAGYPMTTNAYQPGTLFVRRGNSEWQEWNPLKDNGDALELAVNLCIHVCPGHTTAVAIDSVRGTGTYQERVTDPYAATRRAIVRAAAALGADK